MRTPAWARRTLAGARSPVRASSLPAMLSWVTSTARAAELLGEGDGDRAADRVEHHDVAVVGQRDRRRGGRRRRRRRPRRRRRRTRGRRAATAGALHDARRRRARRSCRCARRRRGGRPRRPASRRARRSGRRRRPARRASSRARRASTRWPRIAGDAGRLQPGRAAADDDDVAGRARRRVPVGVLGLAARRRLADARHERVAGVADLARLVAAGARADALGRRRRAAWRRGRGRRSGPGSSRRRRTRPGRRSRRAPTRPGRRRRPSPAATTGTSTAAATAAASSTLKPVGWWKSGRVCSIEKIEPRTTTT